jgi:antitoxin component of MazEF toxin-antitoxin module
MGNVDNFTNAPIVGKTILDINYGNSTAMVIPKEFARELQIENYRVSMSIIVDPEDNGHLLVSEFQR